jgi:hypothetical protein
MAAALEAAIADAMQAVECPEDVLVILDDGNVAYMLEMGR